MRLTVIVANLCGKEGSRLVDWGSGTTPLAPTNESPSTWIAHGESRTWIIRESTGKHNEDIIVLCGTLGLSMELYVDLR